jgi:excinuclease ABC subunit C
VDALFSHLTFTDFGPDHLHPAPQPPPVRRLDGPGTALLRRGVRDDAPQLPGVYGMLDRHGDLIYIGKAKSLRTRLLSYFRPRSRDAKAGRIVNHTSAVVWEVCPSEFAALHRELELIRRWRPRFNVQGQPTGLRYAYICLGRKPAPYVFMARRPPAGVLASFGPVPAGRRAGAAVRWANDWFRLRDCAQSQEMVFAEQGELFPVQRAPGCLRHEIGTCLGPCAAACTRAAYAVQVSAARAFLAGTDTSALKQLQREMAAASEGLAFERAAALRDKLQALRWLHEQLEALREARAKGSFVYPVDGHDGSRFWYLVRGGWTVTAVAAPTESEGHRRVKATLEAVYRPEQAAGAELTERVEGVLLVASWFHRYPEERARVLQPGDAIARCSSG